jgi:hypothetical protein
VRLALALIVVGLLAAGVGFAVRSWAIIPAAVLVWPTYFLGLHESWWGNGLGDGWIVLLALFAVATAVAASLGVLARSRRQNRPSS